ncbi:NAD(P)-dependent oxidoreductase [Micromonospora krabiensis]|uniref:3-hydroxyisobutyrate dehydrogenase n=1 Tax=Micromonospora krabiensis TaxID=307121 RepID=A0A1C3N099_9ACTN|nr:NAD(P)-dependent oxidoreductase [Micromonospora krabiensis]SBV26012.1 3-hydroxyisobutyrate dehydrogenase [Micromonospora krabiensis]
MAGTQRVAVLGLGGMGEPMAVNILRAGLPTAVWNRRPERARRLGEQGARVADSPADAVDGADVVITMVTDADAVLSIADEQGMLAAVPDGAIWAQMSTIGVDGTERVARLVAERRPGVVLLDAPVAGSRGPAEQGKLLVLASGPPEVRERIAPVFDAVGQRTVWAGPVGAGSRLKLANNLLLAFLAEGIAEALALGRALGLDRATVIGALQGGPLVSPWAAEKLERIGRDDYSPQYPLNLALKDVDLALREVEADRFAVAASLAERWRRAVGQGLGGDDVTVVTRALDG